MVVSRINLMSCLNQAVDHIGHLTPAELKEAIAECKCKSEDMAVHRDERPLWKDFARLLRSYSKR